MQTSRKIVHGPYAILEIRGNTFEENSFYGCPLSMDALHKSSLIILWPSLLLPSSPMSITGLVGISVGTSIVENAEYVNLGVGWVGDNRHTKQVNVEDWRVLGTDISRWC